MSSTLAYNLEILDEIISIKCQDLDNNSRNIRSLIHDYVIKVYEDSVSPDGFYIMKILDVRSFSESETNDTNGIINEITGDITYRVMFSAFVFCPVVGSVFEIKVTKCNDVGIWGVPESFDCSNNEKHVVIECMSSADMIESRHYNKGIYVSNKNDKNNEKSINVNSIVKLKVLNAQIEYNKITVFGSVLYS